MLQNWPKNGYSYLFLSQLLILAGDNSLNANSGPIAVATAAPTVKLLQLGQNSLKSPAQLRLRALLVAALAQTISSGQPARSALAHLATADNGPELAHLMPVEGGTDNGHRPSPSTVVARANWDPFYMYQQDPDTLAGVIALIVIGAVLGRRLLEYLAVLERAAEAQLRSPQQQVGGA